MTTVNDALLGRLKTNVARRVRCWALELSMVRQLVQHLRKRFQRGRHANVEDLAHRKAEYLRSLKMCNERIVTVNEDKWRSFVRDTKEDPWGKVHRIFRGKSRLTWLVLMLAITYYFYGGNA